MGVRVSPCPQTDSRQLADIVVINTEGVHDETKNATDGYHDQKPYYAPEHMLLPFFSRMSLAEIIEVTHESPDEQKEAGRYHHFYRRDNEQIYEPIQ